MANRKYYCGFKTDKEGAVTSKYVAITRKPTDLFHKRSEEKREEVKSEKNAFEGILNDYSELLNGLYHSVPFVMFMLPAFKRVIFMKEIFAPIDKSGRKIESTIENTAIYEIDDHRIPSVMRVMEKLDSIDAFYDLAPKMFLGGIVAAYDGFLGQLLKHVFVMRPEKISASEKPLSFSEIVRLGSIEAAREYIVEREADAILRGSHADHFTAIKRMFKIDVEEQFDRYNQFLEICERRNLFTHNDGLVSQSYMEFLTSRGLETNDIAMGQKLEVTPKYLEDALNIFYEIGVKLAHVLWRKFGPRDSEKADHNLNHNSVDLITQRRYALAQRILEFGIGLRNHSSELVRLMMVVNLANAYSMGNNSDKAKEILDGEDWSAAAADFRVSVAAILGDWDEAAKLAPQMGASDETRLKLLEWPVLANFRETPQFASTYAKLFGESFDGALSELTLEDASSNPDVHPADESAHPETPTRH